MTSTKMTNFTMIPNDACRDKNLIPYERSVLNYLASLNPCYPSYEDIAQGTGISRGKVAEILSDLRAQNVIDWIPGNSKGKNNLYTIRTSSEWRLVPKNEKPSKVKESKAKTAHQSSEKTETIQTSPSVSGTESPLRDGSSLQRSTPIIPINNISNYSKEDLSIKDKSSLNNNSDSYLNSNLIDNNTNPPVRSVDSTRYSIDQFKRLCQYMGLDSPETQDYFFRLIKADKRLSIGFIEIENILREYDLERFGDEALESYRAAFRQARTELTADL